MPKKIFFSQTHILAKILLVIFCIVGILDTFFLVYGELFLKNQCVPLTFLPNNCNLVLKSAYGTVWGLPLALIGFIGYSSLLGFFLLSLRESKMILTVIFGSFLGLLASAYLTYLQGFVLMRWCFLCLLSATAMAIIFFSAIFLAFFSKKKIHLQNFNLKDISSKIVGKSISLFLIILAVTLAIFESIRSRKWQQQADKTGNMMPIERCQLFSYPHPYAMIDNKLITTQELDQNILGSSESSQGEFAETGAKKSQEKKSSEKSLEKEFSPICEEINHWRLQSLHMLLIEKEMRQQAENTALTKKEIYPLFFRQHGILFPRGHKITHIRSFIEALEKMDDKERRKIEKQLSTLRAKYKVIIND